MRYRTANTVLAWLMVGVLLWPSQTLHSCCCAARAAALSLATPTPASPTATSSTTQPVKPCCRQRAARLAASTRRPDSPRRAACGVVSAQRLLKGHPQSGQWQARCCCDEARSAHAQGVSTSRARLVVQAPQELFSGALSTAPHVIAHREQRVLLLRGPNPHSAPPDLSLLCRWLI